MEYETVHLQNPEIQKYISQNAARDEAFFRDPKNLEDDLFFKAKTLVYTQLNLFDELLSLSSSTSGIWAFLRPTIVEQKDWEGYIKEKLRHPFYRSILIHEDDIYGASLREFWKRNRKAIEAKPANPFIW